MARADEVDLQAVEAFARRVEAASSALFITGAGISADSGLPTYRGVGGLYDRAVTPDGMPIEVALSGEMMASRPDVSWKYIREIEAACRGARPNPAHEVIARLEQRIERLWVLTQNVDGLHRAAGSSNVIEIHGNVRTLICTRCDYREEVENFGSLPEGLPACTHCAAPIRPEVVLFNEMLPAGAVAALQTQMTRGFDLVVSIGTSAAFPYIAQPMLIARMRGASTVEINPSRSEVTDFVDLHLEMRARPALEALWAALA